MSSVKCPTCNSDNIMYDASKGEYTCSCGRVLQENTVVSELNFSDSNVVGKFGSQSGDYSQIKCLLGYSNNAKEYRRQSVYRQIQQLASKLNLPQYHIEAAKRLYNIAQERNYELGHDKNFTQGRPTSHVIAAALYITCRLEKTPHLLIDFSDALQINLYVLGACYLKFVKYLHLDLPLIDPSLFIHRFCAKLEFGEKTHAVALTALRLLQRMKRDWMTYGRRPNSLCGAAILIAARYHGFKRTTAQIVRNVHVSDETIRKRLEEFKKTTVASLTREEFETMDLEKDIEGELDPPSFTKSLEQETYKSITNYENELRKEAEFIEQQLCDENEKDEDEDKENTKVDMNKNVIDESNKGNRQIAIRNEEKPVVVHKEEPLVDINNYNESLSDIDEDEVNQFILTPAESSLKSLLWHHIHKEWIEKQKLKEESASRERSTVRRRQTAKPKELINAPDPITALTSSSKLGERVNEKALKSLFDDKIIKKLKTE